LYRFSLYAASPYISITNSSIDKNEHTFRGCFAFNKVTLVAERNSFVSVVPREAVSIALLSLMRFSSTTVRYVQLVSSERYTSQAVAYHGIFFQQIQLRTEGRENGDLGAVAH
jgi:hypothetical protein